MTLLLLLGGVGLEPGVDGPGGTRLLVEISFTDPFATPSWVDVSERVLLEAGITTSRGRSSELDQFRAGTATFTLDNSDRAFDPTHDDSPYAGGIKPLRPCRISASKDGTTERLFTGYITGWPQSYGGPADTTATVAIDAVDAFGLLALVYLLDVADGFTLDDDDLGVLDEDRLAPDLTGDASSVTGYTGDIARALLEAIDYPAIACDQGLSTVTAEVPTGSILTRLQDLERSEDGFCYVAADGTVTFLQRTARQDLERIVEPQAALEDTGDGMSYGDIGFTYDADVVYNDIRRTGISGEAQSAEDLDSIATYGRRTNEATLLTVSDAETRDLCVLFLDRYRDPMLRATQVRVPIHVDVADKFTDIVARELLDRIALRRLPQGVGEPIEVEQLLEGIAHSIDTFTWIATLDLSPGFITSWFTLDDDDLGVLDESILGG